jgi:hypothetical protein
MSQSRYGLADVVGTEQAEHLAGGDLEVDAAGGLNPPGYVLVSPLTSTAGLAPFRKRCWPTQSAWPCSWCWNH